MNQQVIEDDPREPSAPAGAAMPAVSSWPPWKRWLLLVALAAACMLIGFRRYTRVTGFGFTKEYLNIAATSAAQGRYARTIDPETAGPGVPGGVVIAEVQREPLYPLALGVVDKLTRDLIKLVWIQVVAMIVAAALLGEIARRHGGWPAAGGFFVLFLLAPVPHFFSAVLFPYAFQFLLITVSLFLCARGRSQQTWPLLCAGAVLGLAAYERGAYLALPAFVAAGLWLARRRAGITGRATAGFLVAALLVQSPWLVRNARLGVTGMNQMMGYTLGFTYGDLPPRPRDAAEREYDALVRREKSDLGTQLFIWGRTARGQGSFVENDRLVTRYALHECKTHVRRVIKMMMESVKIFPARLCRPSLDFLLSKETRPMQYWHAYLNNNPATLPDWGVFGFAVVGLALVAHRAPALGAMLIATCVYTLLFSTTIISFDPRYRGVVDGILIMTAAVAMAQMTQGFVHRTSFRRGQTE